MQIPCRSPHCAQCRETFQPDCEYVSHIQQSADQWLRNDYCLSCWKKATKEKKPDGHYWQGKIPAKKQKGVTPDERARKLFCKLAKEKNDPKLTYVLMLYLQRKKQLALRPESLVEVVETGEVFEIKAVTLSPEEREAVMAQMQGLIDECSSS